MKKIVSMLMVIAMMAVVLTACGGNDKIIGTWKTEIDMGEEMGLDTEFSATMEMVFNDDKTCEVKIDAEKFEADLRAMMEDLLISTISTALEGQEITEDEAISMYEQATGQKMSDIIDQAIDEAMDEADELEREGTYTFKDDTLTIDYGDEEVEQSKVEFDGDDKMTLIDEKDGDKVFERVK